MEKDLCNLTPGEVLALKAFDEATRCCLECGHRVAAHKGVQAGVNDTLKSLQLSNEKLQDELKAVRAQLKDALELSSSAARTESKSSSSSSSSSSSCSIDEELAVFFELNEGDGRLQAQSVALTKRGKAAVQAVFLAVLRRASSAGARPSLVPSSSSSSSSLSSSSSSSLHVGNRDAADGAQLVDSSLWQFDDLQYLLSLPVSASVSSAQDVDEDDAWWTYQSLASSCVGGAMGMSCGDLEAFYSARDRQRSLPAHLRALGLGDRDF